jgi:RNA-directed DNA polymerase
MQMTEMAPPLSGALSSQVDWDSIDWTQIARMVKRLQRRIAKAAKYQKWGKVKSLQWLLTHSRSAKLLAVKKVTSNRGKKTAGVDGVVWLTTEQKLACVETLNRRGYRPKPLRQIYIPKSNG